MATRKMTHFRNVSGIEGVYVGAVGSEIKIADTSSAVYRGTAGSEFAVSDKDYCVTYSAGAVSAGQLGFISPYAMKVAGAYHGLMATGVAAPGTVTVNVGTAGTTLATAALASGAIGLVSTLTLSDTSTIAAGTLLSINLGASGTAYNQTVTAVFTRMGA